MGCNSDYMNPTGREIQLQRSAKLLIFVYEKLGLEAPDYAIATAKNIYAEDDRSVMVLCDVLHNLSSDKFNNIVYNAKDKTSRDLADWWEEHQEADRKREEEEARELRIKNNVPSIDNPNYFEYLKLKEMFE